MNIRSNIVKISAHNIIEKIHIAYHLCQYQKPFRNDFAFFKLIRVQFNVKMLMDLFLTIPHVEIEDNIFNAQLFWGKQLVMQVHSKYV